MGTLDTGHLPRVCPRRALFHPDARRISSHSLARFPFTPGYPLPPAPTHFSGRFAQLLENVPLANHNNRKSKDKSGKDIEKEREKERRKSVNGSTVTFAPVDSDTLSLSSGSISSESTDHPPGPPQPPTQPPTQPATGNPHVLELKETGERMLLLLEFINYSTTGVAFATRTFTIRKLATLLDLADTYKLKEGPRATLRNYIAKSAHALTLKASGYDDFLGLVRILEQTRSVALARALFRLDWDIERVRLLHLHHLAQPWEMPDDVVAKLSPEMFNAMVYVETERALWSGKVDDLVVSYSKCRLRVGLLGLIPSTACV